MLNPGGAAEVFAGAGSVGVRQDVGGRFFTVLPGVVISVRASGTPWLTESIRLTMVAGGAGSRSR
ncbi:MAG: hypothetical protein BGP03_05665 [Pseudonocardia sp. 73-21]|nr:MAG: hypothetical protein BGP03_05665 [Pseudonocardia sp. 73-21]